jgi:ADP-ribose diphosphatase
LPVNVGNGHARFIIGRRHVVVGRWSGASFRLSVTKAARAFGRLARSHLWRQSRAKISLAFERSQSPVNDNIAFGFTLFAAVTSGWKNDYLVYIVALEQYCSSRHLRYDEARPTNEIAMPEPQEPKSLFTGRHLLMLAQGRWEYVTRTIKRPAVAIVAVTDDDRVILVEQFRPPVGECVIELPAGLTGDVAGSEDESLVDSAKRELLEETGYEASQWSELARGYSSPGLTDELIVLFLAKGLTKTGLGGGDASESITVHEVPLDGVIAWLADKRSKVDFKLLAGLYAAQQLNHR